MWILKELAKMLGGAFDSLSGKVIRIKGSTRWMDLVLDYDPKGFTKGLSMKQK